MRVTARPNVDLHQVVLRHDDLTIERVSQDSWFYISVSADSDDAALSHARELLSKHGFPPDSIELTTPDGPDDQPGSLPPLNEAQQTDKGDV